MLLPTQSKGTRRCITLPYFLHARDRLASANQKIKLFSPDVLYSFLVMTSHTNGWRPTMPLDWFHMCLKTQTPRGVPIALLLPTQCLVPFWGNHGCSCNQRHFHVKTIAISDAWEGTFTNNHSSTTENILKYAFTCVITWSNMSKFFTKIIFHGSNQEPYNQQGSLIMQYFKSINTTKHCKIDHRTYVCAVIFPTIIMSLPWVKLANFTILLKINQGQRKTTYYQLKQYFDLIFEA